MKLLELFSGTGYVGKVAKKYDFEVVSSDMDMDADIKMNIMDWNYKELPPIILTLFGHHLHVLSIALQKQLG